MSNRWSAFSVGSYASDRAFKGAKAAAPIDYPEVGALPPRPSGSPHRQPGPADLPQPEKTPVATVGLLMMRSYVLASDKAHYDSVIRKMQARRPRRDPGLRRRPRQPPGNGRVISRVGVSTRWCR